MPWIAAATAIGGWLSSEQGRRASAAERKKMQNMLDNLKDPNFQTESIDYPTFQILEKYVPQVSDYVKEVDPKFVEMSAEAKEGRGAQLEALRRLQQAGSSEGDILQDTAINQANREAGIANQGMQGSILENMRRRGTGGTGLELAAQLSAQQAAAERGALGSQNAATEGYRNRLQALKDSGSLGGQIRDDEVSLADKNASILNDFNQRGAANMNSYNRYADSTINDASRYNIGEAQRINEKNLGGKYDAANANKTAYNQTQQQKFQNNLSKITGQQSQSAMNQQAISNNTKDQNNMIQGAGNAATAYQQKSADDERRQQERQDAKAKQDHDDAERQKDRETYQARGSDQYRY